MSSSNDLTPRPAGLAFRDPRSCATVSIRPSPNGSTSVLLSCTPRPTQPPVTTSTNGDRWTNGTPQRRGHDLPTPETVGERPAPVGGNLVGRFRGCRTAAGPRPDPTGGRHPANSGARSWTQSLPERPGLRLRRFSRDQLATTARSCGTLPDRCRGSARYNGPKLRSSARPLLRISSPLPPEVAELHASTSATPPGRFAGRRRCRMGGAGLRSRRAFPADRRAKSSSDPSRR